MPRSGEAHPSHGSMGDHIEAPPLRDNQTLRPERALDKKLQSDTRLMIARVGSADGARGGFPHVALRVRPCRTAGQLSRPWAAATPPGGGWVPSPLSSAKTTARSGVHILQRITATIYRGTEGSVKGCMAQILRRRHPEGARHTARRPVPNATHESQGSVCRSTARLGSFMQACQSGSRRCCEWQMPAQATSE